MENKIEIIEARSFTVDEINEINSYISANVPYSILQTIFPLTENLFQKAQVYTIIFRIINGSKNYVEDIKTRIKLKNLLDENNDIYNELYKLLSLIENSNVNYGKHMIKNKIRLILNDFDKNFKINKLIDIFLIFSEKLVLLDTNKVAGLEIDSEEGREMYKKIIGNVEIKNENI